jgi:hypothetical protein
MYNTWPSSLCTRVNGFKKIYDILYTNAITCTLTIQCVQNMSNIHKHCEMSTEHEG